MATFYKRILAVGAVLIFYTNLDLYLYTSSTVSFPPLLWITGFGIAAVPLLLSCNFLTVFRRSPVVGWCYSFVMVSAVWLFFLPLQNDSAWDVFRLRILSVLFILMMFFIFSNGETHAWARRTILIAVLGAVALNIYELFYPGSFSYVTGRSAGLYVNPNKSGTALLLGMIFSVGLLPHKYRMPFALLVGLGVLLTFSRAAMIGWPLVATILVLTGEIRLKRSLIVGCMVLVIGIAALLPWWNDLLFQPENVSMLNADGIERLQWLESLQNFNVESSDYSTLERKEVAGLAWNMFAEKPILGHGVGASMDWGFHVSSHNQYLNMMVDHGILGLFILPSLIAASVWRPRGKEKRI